MPQQLAGRMAMIGFAASLLAGALAKADIEGAVWSALTAGAAFYAVGFVVGEFGRRIAEMAAQADFEKQLKAETVQTVSGNP